MSDIYVLSEGNSLYPYTEISLKIKLENYSFF